MLNDLKIIKIGEDKFGKVEYIGLESYEIESTKDFIALNEQASKNRMTTSTFKNDTSSRSHSICRIKIENVVQKCMEPGEMYIIDLAGSESASDSQFHDKALLK